MPHLYVHPNTQIQLSLNSLVKYAQYQWLIDKNGVIFRNSSKGPITLEFCVKVDKGINSLAEVKYRDSNPLNLSFENLIEIPFKLTSQYSAYRGITYDINRGKWIAQLTSNGHRVLYKRLNSEQEALNALNAARKQVGLSALDKTPKLS